jgi:hypothetical protein
VVLVVIHGVEGLLDLDGQRVVLVGQEDGLDLLRVVVEGEQAETT